MEPTMAESKWALRGEYMESCNCDYLCPCIYTNPQGPATFDHCTAVMVFRIDEGSFGETKLDGLKFALVIRSGKVMADGNWIFAGVVDDGADEAQRTALAAIVGGEAGGTPAVIRQNLVSDFRGIAFKPIEFHMDALKRAASIPDVLAFEIEGVLSRNRSGEPFYIDNTGLRIYPALIREASNGNAKEVATVRRLFRELQLQRGVPVPRLTQCTAHGAAEPRRVRRGAGLPHR
jgi:hypothetical protein